jgi:hypothetical protein
MPIIVHRQEIKFSYCQNYYKSINISIFLFSGGRD